MDGSENNENTADMEGVENGFLTNGGTEHDHGDDSGENGSGGGENRLLFDFSNDMMFDSSGRLMRKPRRKHNPDRDKYIQEPQYVTKRTSSGRLVKMKISTDFDYTSDQEEEGKRRRKEEDDDDTMEGIQAKHRKEGDMVPEYGQYASHRRVHQHRHRKGSDNDDVSSMSSRSSGDEDFNGNKYSSKRASVSGVKPKRTYTRTPRRPVSASNSSRRMTVKELTEGGSNPGGIFDSDDSGSSQEEFILPRSRPFKTTVSPAGPSSSSTASTQPATSSSKLTFDQYVKKISTGGACTVGQALAMADAAKSTSGGGVGTNTAMTTRPPLTKVNSPSSLMTTSSTSKPGLTVPIINPAIKTILSKLNTGNQPIQQTPAGNRIILNASASTGSNEHTKQTVKLIAVNSTSTTNASGKDN